MSRSVDGRGRDIVALVLAVGIATAVNALMFAVLYDALRSDTPGLSENSTQVIISAFTGIIGVLGGYVGGRSAERRAEIDRDRDAERAPLPPGETPAHRPGDVEPPGT